MNFILRINVQWYSFNLQNTPHVETVVKLRKINATEVVSDEWEELIL